MPYPKGINDPEVRARFIAERKATIAEFDRLRGEGLPRDEAARRVGVTPMGLRAMRRSVEQLSDEGFHAGRDNGKDIDRGLALLSILRKPGESLDLDDMAPWCNCSRSALWAIEQRALRKVRSRLMEIVRDAGFPDEVAALFAGSPTR